MRQLILALALLTLASPAPAQYYAAVQPSCATGNCPRQATTVYRAQHAQATPAVVHAQPAQRAQVTYQSTYQVTYQADGPAEFLALLNAERARYGRGPVGWDQDLAAYASRNNGVHAPGSIAPGSRQCWAGCRSYRQAFRLWMGSPAHRDILINARTAVGCSPCASGISANAR